MDERINNYLKISLYVALGIFACMCIIEKPLKADDFLGYIGKSVTITFIMMIAYEKWIWRFNPLSKTPKLKKKYNGIIEYNIDGTSGMKDTSIYIKQTLLNTYVKIMTDEISSNTIVSKIINENDEYILYYTYITNPKSKCSEKNPIQYGACRLMLDDTAELRGTYWTSRKTIGDIYFKSDSL